jgi:IS30 family transposase
LQNDNGTEFANKIIDALVKKYAIDHRFIRPSRPQGDGLVERKNKEVKRFLNRTLVGLYSSSNTQLVCISEPFLFFEILSMVFE